MKRHIGNMVIASLMMSPALGNGTGHPTKHLLVVVTTDEPVTRLMSVVLAAQSVEKGTRVDALLCGEAGFPGATTLRKYS